MRENVLDGGRVPAQNCGRRFLTYSAYLLIMATAGSRTNQTVMKLSHNLLDYWARDGFIERHTSTYHLSWLSTIRKPCLSRNLNQVRVEVCFLVISSR